MLQLSWVNEFILVTFSYDIVWSSSYQLIWFDPIGRNIGKHGVDCKFWAWAMRFGRGACIGFIRRGVLANFFLLKYDLFSSCFPTHGFGRAELGASIRDNWLLYCGRNSWISNIAAAFYECTVIYHDCHSWMARNKNDDHCCLLANNGGKGMNSPRL